MKPVDIFHIGPQKSATTWIYRCLKEHPQIACPSTDTIHYFDIFYAKGRSWYAAFFHDALPEQKLFDPTPSYIRSPWAPRRIAEENPRARIVICLRNPIERAFSHYWHSKKKKELVYDFSRVFTNYDLFASWMEPGFYAEHIERYLAVFSREQILCQRFEDLVKDPRGFLESLLVFIGVEADFLPSILNTKVNIAGVKQDLGNRIKAKLGGWGGHFLPGIWKKLSLDVKLSGREEYLQGIPEELHRTLFEICLPEIERLENLLGIDLSAWKTKGAS